MNVPGTTDIVLIAGEASGDQHAAHLVSNIKATHPTLTFAGIGGQTMQSAGVTVWFNLAQHAVVGITEVIRHLPMIRKAFNVAKHQLQTNPPKLLILIDYPDFNLRLAHHAKRLGIRTLYYISPQIWAWRQARIKKIRRYIDMMAVIFPFEVPLYQAAKVPVHFVGHPLAHSVKAKWTTTQGKQFFGLSEEGPIIGLLPGSRLNEIKQLLPIMLTAAKQLQQYYPKAQFVLPIASSLNKKTIEQHLAIKLDNLYLVEQERYDAIHCCDVLMICSGTATLEASLLAIPMVIVYKTSRLSYFVGKCLIRSPHIGLCNVLAERTIVPELIQKQCTSEALVKQIKRYLHDKVYYQQTKKDLLAVSQSLLKNSKKTDLNELVLTLLET